MTVDGAGAPDSVRRSARDDGKGFSASLNELAGLVIGYVKQETIDPIKALGRFVAFGAAGSILLTAGGVLLALTAVRAAQGETGSHLHGNLTWVPYAAGVIVAGGGAAWAALRIGKGRERR